MLGIITRSHHLIPAGAIHLIRASVPVRGHEIAGRELELDVREVGAEIEIAVHDCGSHLWGGLSRDALDETSKGERVRAVLEPGKQLLRPVTDRR